MALLADFCPQRVSFRARVPVGARAISMGSDSIHNRELVRGPVFRGMEGPTARLAGHRVPHRHGHNRRSPRRSTTTRLSWGGAIQWSSVLLGELIPYGHLVPATAILPSLSDEAGAHQVCGGLANPRVSFPLGCHGVVTTGLSGPHAWEVQGFLSVRVR